MYNHNEELEKAKVEIAEKELENELREENEAIIFENGNEEKSDMEDNQIILSNGEIIAFDFSKLTGTKIVVIKDKYQRIRKRKASLIGELDEVYLMLIAEAGCGIPYTTLLNYKYQDFLKIKNLVSDFLQED
ncbi:MAG: hypothetical protein LBT51_10565 [Fusobacteriaceae bacterium]|jgi:hypothetical protein|nr:hypothetical protein [Fusobacteriaceae bacterium]